MGKNCKVKFAPQIYTDWHKIFINLSDKERSEILLGISDYPNYEPDNIMIWDFIKTQIDKQYENFKSRCDKNAEISRNFWGDNKKNISNDNQSISNYIHNNNCNLKSEPKIITELKESFVKNSTQITITKEFKFEKLFPEYSEYQELCSNLNNWFIGKQLGKIWHIKSIQQQAQNFINKNHSLLGER